MNLTAQELKTELLNYANESKIPDYLRFFRTEKGSYGENDKFIGVSVPDQRKVVKLFHEIPLPELQKLIKSDIHEHRLTALMILVNKYKKAKLESEKKVLIDFYLSNINQVNNWDLVDTSASILGDYLKNNPELLYKMAKSEKLWHQRIAVIATYVYIKNNEFADTLAIAEILINHKHDLIHKAVGWMLREVGKRDESVLRDFLNKHHKKMPRTMLRYAIEKFPEDLRQKYLTR